MCIRPQILILFHIDHLCGLWSGFLATDTEVPGSIPGATRFSEWWWVWDGVHSAS
jgi:hypothetical protein